MNRKELRIYNLFRKYGFSEEESAWAVDQNLDPKGEKGWQIKKQLRNRLNRVKVVMRHYRVSREEAIRMLEKARRRASEQSGEDPDNIFLSETP